MNILVINCHPTPESYNAALCASYIDGARASGATVQLLEIGKLHFNPSLQFGFSQRVELEPDLVKAQELIQWADHLVWVHPVWWGGLPAVTKGFIDRVFLPGFAFKYRKNSVWWDRLLKGKTARIITTADEPYLYYLLVPRRPGINQLKRAVLHFCGVKPVKITFIGSMRMSDENYRKKHLNRVAAIGRKEGR